MFFVLSSSCSEMASIISSWETSCRVLLACLTGSCRGQGKGQQGGGWRFNVTYDLPQQDHVLATDNVQAEGDIAVLLANDVALRCVRQNDVRCKARVSVRNESDGGAVCVQSNGKLTELIETAHGANEMSAVAKDYQDAFCRR